MDVKRAGDIALTAYVGMVMAGALTEFRSATGLEPKTSWADRKQQRVYLIAVLDYVLARFTLLRAIKEREKLTARDLRQARAVLERVVANWDDRR